MLMQRRRRRPPEDANYNLLCPAGRDNLNRLFRAEVLTMADNHSKGANYRKLRKNAVEFIEKHYTVSNYDALIPYMAMTYVDRVYFDGKKIPDVVGCRDNTTLFLVCCLFISWKLRTKTFALQDFLNEQQLTHISVENVIEMESRICRKLDWRLRTVTPFWFMEFFAPYLTFPSKVTKAKTLRFICQLIVKAQCAMIFTQFRPSVIAVSAIQIVAANLLPDQVSEFEENVISDETFTPDKDSVHRCIRMLEQLYDGPTGNIDPAPVERGPSSSGPPRRSDPIPIPQLPTRPKGKEVAFSYNDKPSYLKRGEPYTSTSDDHDSSSDEVKEGDGDEFPLEKFEGIDDVEDGGVAEVKKGGGTSEIQPVQEGGVAEVEEGGGTSEIQPVQEGGVAEVEEGGGVEAQPEQEGWLARFYQDGENTDDLMKFKLKWTEALTEVEDKNLDQVEDGSAHFLTYLAGRFCGACIIL